MLGSKDVDRYLATRRPEADGVAMHVYAGFQPSVIEHSSRQYADSRVLKLEGIRYRARGPYDANRLWTVSEEVGLKLEC